MCSHAASRPLVIATPANTMKSACWAMFFRSQLSRSGMVSAIQPFARHLKVTLLPGTVLSAESIGAIDLVEWCTHLTGYSRVRYGKRITSLMASESQEMWLAHYRFEKSLLDLCILTLEQGGV